jgi:transcriptional regulator of acetoin/glycerol metabolism
MTNSETPGESTPQAVPTTPPQPTDGEQQRQQREERRMTEDAISVMRNELERARKESIEDRLAKAEAIKERDAALAQVKEFEGRVQAMTEEAKGLEAITKERDEIKALLEAQREAVHTELVNRLPEDKRERYAGLSTDALRLVVEDLVPVSTATPQSPEAGAPGAALTADTVDFSKMTITQVAELEATNPDLYREAIAKQITQPSGTLGGFM